LLGRTKKMRLALTLAAAGATGAAGSPRALLQRGLKQLGSSPELGELTKVARGQLVGAAKSAAITAASGRIDALNERLQNKPSEKDSGNDDSDVTSESKYDESENELRDEKETSRDDEYDEDEPPGAEQDDDEESERRRRRPTRRAPSRRPASADSGGNAGQEQPRRAARSRTGRAPVRRAGR
jgi:hypothetical protein